MRARLMWIIFHDAQRGLKYVGGIFDGHCWVRVLSPWCKANNGCETHVLHLHIAAYTLISVVENHIAPN